MKINIHNLPLIEALKPKVLGTLFCLLSLASCNPTLFRDIMENPHRSKGPAVPKQEIADLNLDQFELVDGHDAEIIALFSVFDFSLGSKLKLLSVDKEGEVLAWSTDSLQAYKIMSVGQNVRSCVLSDDSRLLAIHQGAQVRVFSLPEQKEIAVLKRLKTRPASLAFEPNAASLVIGAADGRIYRWIFGKEEKSSVAKEFNKRYQRYIGHSSVVSAIAFHPFGGVFFSGDWRGGLKAWQPYDQDLFMGAYDKNIFDGDFYTDIAEKRSAGRQNKEAIEKLVVNSNGDYLLVALQNGQLELWDVRGLKMLTTIKAHTGRIADLAVSADPLRLVTYGRDAFLRFWRIEKEEDKVGELSTFEFVKEYEVNQEGLKKVSFLESDMLITASIDAKLKELSLTDKIKGEKVAGKEGVPS